MTVNELKCTMEKVIKEDSENAGKYRPIVAIGHTKDLLDFETYEYFLSYLRKKRIGIISLIVAYDNCLNELTG